MDSKNRKALTLKERMEVLKYIDEGNSERAAAKKFGISKGAVSLTKSRREEYTSQYEDVKPHGLKKSQGTHFEGENGSSQIYR